MVNDYLDALNIYAGTENKYGAAFNQDGTIANISWNENNPKPQPTDEQLADIVNNQLVADREAKANLKASAKAKLVAGEPLTEDEANVMIGG